MFRIKCHTQNILVSPLNTSKKAFMADALSQNMLGGSPSNNGGNPSYNVRSSPKSFPKPAALHFLANVA